MLPEGPHTYAVGALIVIDDWVPPQPSFATVSRGTAILLAWQFIALVNVAVCLLSR